MIEKITIDLEASLIRLHFRNQPEPLLVSFNSPSRKFYLSLIGLVLSEMKKRDKPGYVFIRSFEKELKKLDKLIAGPYASQSTEGMWEKIRKAWRYGIPDLETAELFSILNREKLPPFEKGSKYRYNCSEIESDVWANLFQFDELNVWKLKFAFDANRLGFDDVILKFGKLSDIPAWAAFKQHIENIPETHPPYGNENIKLHPGNVNRQKRIYFVTVIFIVVIVIAGGLISRHLRSSHRTESLQKGKISIAVLPFINISDNSEYEYFSDGITEELINMLRKINGLRVISRTSAFYFKDKDVDLHKIEEKLNVENILEGSVRVSGDQLRISAQLIDVKHDSHLWTGTYNRRLTDVFDIQEKLAQEIACSLKSRLGCEGDEIVDRYSNVNLDAYKLYMKGRYYFYKLSYQTAVDHFQRAIGIDPDYAAAYAGLADAYSELAFYFAFKPTTQYIQRAKSAALKALEIDAGLPEAYVALANLQFLFDWDWKGVERSLRKAIEINPAVADVHSLYGHFLRAMGRLDEAIAEGEKSLEIDPLSVLANNRYGLSLLTDHHYKAAVNHLEATLDMFPDDLLTMQYLGEGYLLQKRYVEGTAVWDKVFHKFREKAQFVYGTVGYAYTKLGRSDEARSILNEVLRIRKTSNFTPFAIALIYKGLGKVDETFEWLDTAYAEHDPAMVFLLSYPQLWDLHTDPRFKILLGKMGLKNNRYSAAD